MCVDLWVDWGICHPPLMFEVEGMPRVVSPYFGGKGGGG